MGFKKIPMYNKNAAKSPKLIIPIKKNMAPALKTTIFKMSNINDEPT